MTITAKSIYEKFSNGSSMSDDELTYGIQIFKQLSVLLYEVGPEFRLAAVEANRVCMALQSFEFNRKQR